MAAKKDLKQTIINTFMDHVLVHNKIPSSVYTFCKALKIDESEFYKHFASFTNLEEHIFVLFFEKSTDLVASDASYENYNSREKLLTLYYTLFEMFTANRSYVVWSIGDHKKITFNELKKFKAFKIAFTNFIDSLDLKLANFNNSKIKSFSEKSVREGAWLQLLITIKFWLDDTSNSFEKTDIYIEKSVNTSFDIIDTSPINSLVDLGKFIFNEKIKM